MVLCFFLTALIEGPDRASLLGRRRFSLRFPWFEAEGVDSSDSASDVGGALSAGGCLGEAASGGGNGR